jgi:fumarate reductase flavoprotein subunit
MMGGVEFAADCTTECEGLYAAGEDSGGVHGANRLGGNGVANSTVFGAIAGDTMARAARETMRWRDAEPAQVDDALARARACFGAGGGGPGDLEALRERLHAVMWDDAGIVRDAAGLARADAALDDMRDALARHRLPQAARDPAFNLAWHEWLNLANLVGVSKAIVASAQAREDSRGAHFRADHPRAGDLAASSFTRIRLEAGARASVRMVPVRFTRVAPGQSLVA